VGSDVRHVIVLYFSVTVAIQLAAEFVRDNEVELFTAAHELASALSRITITDL